MIKPYMPSFEDVFAMTFDDYFLPAEDYVSNPFMGFVGYAHSDHMNQNDHTDRFEYTEPSMYDIERLIKLPFCDNIYIRVEWRDMQNEKGKLNVMPLFDRTVELCRKYDKPWSLRVMNTCTGTRYENSYPEFLQNKLKFNIVDNHEAAGRRLYYAEYDDIYLGYWDEFLRLLAERYDDDPLLSFADISGYGLWGEFHHSNTPELEKPEHGEVIVKLIDSHMDAFKKTPAVSMFTANWRPQDDEWKNPAQLHAFDRGAWIRRDMFYPFYSSVEYDVARQVQQHGGAMIFESGHYPDVTRSHRWDVQKMPYRDIFRMMLYYNSTYMGIGFNPWQAFRTTEGYYEQLKDASKTVGYRIYPTVVRSVNNSVDGQRINIAFKNDGVAYPPGQIELNLKFKNGVVLRHTLPGSFFAPGQMNYTDIVFPNEPNIHFAEGRPIKGNYFDLSATIKAGKKKFPLKFAVKAADDASRENLRVIMPSVEK